MDIVSDLMDFQNGVKGCLEPAGRLLSTTEPEDRK